MLLRILRMPALLLVLATVCAPQQAFSQEQVLDEIVAIVGDQILLRSEVDGMVLGLTQQRGLEYSDGLWLDALNQIIDQKVLSIHAQRDTTIQVSDDQVDQALNRRIDQLIRQLGSTSRLEEIYGKSLIQIRADLREDFHERLLAEQMQGTKIRQIKITPSEVADWFNQFPTDSLPTLPETVRVSHIVRHPEISEEAKEEALEIISTIRDSVEAGISMLEDMARRFSEDPGSAENGGRFEEISLRDLVPEFAAVASRIEPGTLSEPFETAYGYHILRVNTRRGDLLDLNHILIKIDESKSDPTNALATLTTLRDSIVTYNVPFELIARRHSQEAFSSEIGGRVVDPNTGERDLFLDALGVTWRQALDTLEIGTISQPTEVELLDGSRSYHIVTLQQRVPTHRVDIVTDFTRIEQLALQNKQNRIMRQWLDDLRKEVYIELRGKAVDIKSRIPGSADAGARQRN
ncbi:MAG: peptidylprolyl isomerase [Rhodothermales bacterium]